jgi:hypothetical protein
MIWRNWPVGHALCIFFGPTPTNVGERPRAYSPVNIPGRVVGDATHLRIVRSGAAVHLTRLDWKTGQILIGVRRTSRKAKVRRTFA